MGDGFGITGRPRSGEAIDRLVNIGVSGDQELIEGLCRQPGPKDQFQAYNPEREKRQVERNSFYPAMHVNDEVERRMPG